MRIAIVSTPFIRVPPKGYGGTELFCGHLAEALLRRGHRVSLFATGDSVFHGDLQACFRTAVWPPSETAELAHMRWALQQIASDGRYDAVQINSACGLRVAKDLGVPVLCTLHHVRKEPSSRLFAAHPEAHYVAISQRQLDLEAALPSATVIHHGVDVDDYPLSTEDRGYVLHVGRFAAEKGTHLAIDAAQRAHVPIVLAGRTHEEQDETYFERELAPRFKLPGVRLHGEADHAAKIALLRGARALLCPIEWEEPFGLIAIEAMLTGTPVIGFPRGAFPEIVDEGVTGALVSDVAAIAAMIKRARGWDRRRCSQRARERFSSDRMAADYEHEMRALGARTSAPYLVASREDHRRSRSVG